MDHNFNTKDLIRIILNYLIPLSVATYSHLVLIKKLAKNKPNNSTN